jgi:excisionase family DNA binding protein
LSTSCTLSERSRRDKVGRTTIYEAIAAGKLRAKKRGRLTIITDADWQAYLESLPDALASGAISPAKPEKRAA